MVIASLIIGIAHLPPSESQEHKREAGHALRTLKNASVPQSGVFVSSLLFSIFVTFYTAYGADR